MLWNKPCEKKPEQGKKILCMHKGDFYVAQRFGKYWFSIPFYDSEYSRYFEPDLWCEIDFPEGYHGKIRINVDDETMDMETLERKHPGLHQEVIDIQLKIFKSKQPKGKNINRNRKKGVAS